MKVKYEKYKTGENVMTIDEFLKKHGMTAYRLSKISGWTESQISRFRSGEVTWSRHCNIFLNVLDYAIRKGYKSADMEKK